MPYTINVAADVGGHKSNLELEFPYSPTLAELIRQTESVYHAELQARRLPGPFQVSKLQVVDDATDDWTEVVAAHQLRHQCQVYAFQPHSTRYTEAQEHIPPATKPRGFVVQPGASPAAAYPSPSPSPVAAVPSVIHQPTASPLRNYSATGVGAGTGAGAATSIRTARGVSATGIATSSVTYQSRTGTGAPARPLQPTRLLRENATHDDKVRAVFEELDENSNRVVENDEFHRGLKICSLDMSAATTTDLFQRADVDNDGVINFAEFQRFSELYPTLLDYLYFRFKAHWEHVAQEQAVDQQRGLRSNLEEAEQNAQANYAQAQIDAEEATRILTEADRAAGDAANRQRAGEDSARDAARDVDRARQGRTDRERELAAERDRERQAQVRAQDSARELDGLQRNLAVQQNALAEAEAAEHRAAQVLADARRERERQLQLVERAAADADRSAQRHNQMLQEIPAGVEDAVGRLAQSDRELAQSDQLARDMAVKAQDLGRMAEDALRARDSQGQRLAVTRDTQEPKRLNWIETQRALEEHDRRIGEMEAALNQDAESRRQLEDHERGLVEQEVRLREQRNSLMEREEELRSAHLSFYHIAGRTSPVRGQVQRGAEGNGAATSVLRESYHAAHTTSVVSQSHRGTAYSSQR